MADRDFTSNKITKKARKVAPPTKARSRRKSKTISVISNVVANIYTPMKLDFPEPFGPITTLIALGFKSSIEEILLNPFYAYSVKFWHNFLLRTFGKTV